MEIITHHILRRVFPELSPLVVALGAFEIKLDVDHQRHIPERRGVHLIRQHLLRCLHRFAMSRIDVAAPPEPRWFISDQFRQVF